MKLVNIALGVAPISDCSSGDSNLDGEISIDEIITAVNAALYGCGFAASPTPQTELICGTGSEGSPVQLNCDPGIILTIPFASYGTPGGNCGAFSIGMCDAANSQSAVEAECLGRASCSLTASNTVFGDPCSGTVKRLYVQAACRVSR